MANYYMGEGMFGDAMFGSPSDITTSSAPISAWIANVLLRRRLSHRHLGAIAPLAVWAHAPAGSSGVGIFVAAIAQRNRRHSGRFL